MLKPWKLLNWPNRISLLRVLMVAPFIVLLMNQNDPGWSWARHFAQGIFAMMAVSDFLDGQLARRLNQRTRLGAILDPVADKALVVCSVVLLSLKDSAVPGAIVPNWVVVAVVGKDLYLVAGFFVIYLVTDRFCVHPTWAGKACTFGQLIMVLAVLASPDLNWLRPGLGGSLVSLCWWIVIVLTVLAVASYTRLGLSFVVEGDRPLENHGRPRRNHGDSPDADEPDGRHS